jgi:glycerophosphoryl diester phosphodiesterase
VQARDYPYCDAPFLAFAHRGGALHPANLGRENTRHAFAQAAALGYRYLETDVHATADGVLVAFHDDHLDRVTDQVGAVAEVPYEVVATARIGAQDPVPTLAELLTAFPDYRFNVDAKSDGAVDLLAATIAEHDAYDRVCVSSFGIRRLHRLRRLLGRRVASAASSLGVAVHRFLPWLTAVLDTPAPVLQIPLDRRVLGYRLELLTPALLQTVHRAGKQVHVWTIDEPAEMERLVEAGVDGIFTDRPAELKQVLQARGLWTGVRS